MTKLLLLLVIFAGCAQEGTVIPIEGGVMHYREFGQGKPLLVINGGPGMSSEGFTDLAQKLSFYQKVILYDQRGTGKSKLDKTDASTITMDLMVQDIEALRKHLKIEKWSILGHSFGGMLAAHYASAHPQRIDRLVMSSSGGIDLGLQRYVQDTMDSKLTQTGRDSLALFNNRISSGDSSPATRNGRARALAPVYVYKKSNIPIIAKRLTEGDMEVNSLVWQDLRRINFDHSKSFANFGHPVLVIQGKNDILKMSTATAIAAAFPKSELVMLDKCGHYGWLDRPDAYFPALENFLKPD